MRRQLNFRYVWLGILFFGLCLGYPVVAQKITGDISGSVTDSTGAVVPQVSVSVVNAGTSLTRTAVTSCTG